MEWPYRHLIAEVPLRPDPRTKGGGALLSVDGKAIWGPNLDEKPRERDDTSVEAEDYYLL